MKKDIMRYLLTLLIIGMFFATTTAISVNVNENSEVGKDIYNLFYIIYAKSKLSDLI